MSGGNFDYREFHIREIYEQLRSSVYPSDLEDIDDDYTYEIIKESSENVKAEIVKGLDIIGLAYIYAYGIDRFICGDFGEESFMEYLKNNIENFNKTGKL